MSSRVARALSNSLVVKIISAFRAIIGEEALGVGTGFADGLDRASRSAYVCAACLEEFILGMAKDKISTTPQVAAIPQTQCESRPTLDRQSKRLHPSHLGI